MLRDHLINDEERLRITSRAPVDVYIPKLDFNRYTSDFDGNYWPFRAAGISEARDAETGVERTIERTMAFRLIEDRPAGHDFTGDLRDHAEQIHADTFQPSINTGLSRDSIATSCVDYKAHDFSSPVDLIVPIAQPYGLVISCIKNILTDPGGLDGDEPTIDNRYHPTDFALTDIYEQGNSLDELANVVEDLWDVGGNDISIHLHDVYPTAELATYIRQYPNRIATMTLADDAVDLVGEANAGVDGLSSIGGNDLRQSLSPGVRLAGEFSLLISDYLTNDGFDEAVKQSVVPSVSPTTPMEDGYRATLSSEDLTTDDSFSPSNASSTDMQSDLQWYSD